MSATDNTTPAAATGFMIHTPISGVISVRDSLLRLAKSQALQDYLVDRRDLWATFGKMNSDLYRSILMKRMQEAKLTPDQQFMVFFLHSVIKNRDRIIRAMEAMEPADQAQTWFSPVRAFITTHMTQYVSDVIRSKKFPSVNVPSCNPGLDVLVFCLITNPNERSVNELFNRPTASQLHLDTETQAMAKVGYRHYWDSVVTGSKNPDANVPGSKLEAPMFREEFYVNSAGDAYNLIGLDLKEIPPANDRTGYSFEEIVAYLIKIDPRNEYDATISVLDREVKAMNEPVGDNNTNPAA